MTRYGHGATTQQVEVVEAAHPVPDQAGIDAARRILALARSAGADDLVVCLISGGASALLTLPAEGITLEDKQAINRALLRSGAPIGEMNVVRKSLSAIKGGRLAASVREARLVTYLISDVPGDDASSIGSGPTIADDIDPAAALAILRTLSDPCRRACGAGNARECRASGFARAARFTCWRRPRMALDAAAEKARSLGLTPMILGDAIEGEAREVARVFAGITDRSSSRNARSRRPACCFREARRR